MPNDPPYGGRIDVSKNGSVTWTVSAREYTSYRDVDGTVEYAIRVVDQDRNIITSKDGKCIVHVLTEPAKKADPCDHDAHEAQAGVKDGSEATSQAKHLRFLIVTGYDMPAAPANTAIVGKSYFVTWNSFAENENDKIQPRYDLILQYDDYDLERAGLPRTLEPTDLHVCHENWIAVDELWERIFGDPHLWLQIVDNAGANASNAIKANDDYKLDFKSLAIWALVERYLRDAGVTGDLQDILELLLESAKNKRLAQKATTDASPEIFVSNDPATPHSHPGGQPPVHTHTPAREPDHVWMSRWQEVGNNCDRDEGINEVINAQLVRADSFIKTPGSRAITVKGIKHKGLYVLMYHGPRDTHSAGNH